MKIVWKRKSNWLNNNKPTYFSTTLAVILIIPANICWALDRYQALYYVFSLLCLIKALPQQDEKETIIIPIISQIKRGRLRTVKSLGQGHWAGWLQILHSNSGDFGSKIHAYYCLLQLPTSHWETLSHWRVKIQYIFSKKNHRDIC